MPLRIDSLNELPEYHRKQVLLKLERQPGGIKPQSGGKRLVNQTEAEFQAMIIDAAHLHGWKVAHFRKGMTSRTYVNKKGETKNVWVTPVQADGKGFPDLVLVRGSVILFREVKLDDGKSTAEQQHWINLLKGEVWRPSQWERIVEELT